MLQETVTSVVPLLEVQGLVPTAIKAVDGSEALPLRKGYFSCKGTRKQLSFANLVHLGYSCQVA